MLAEVNGVPVMECRCGVSNGQYAVRVERMVSHAQEG
jgi:flagellar motor switch protein FliM